MSGQYLAGDLFNIFKKEMELCKVKGGEVAAIVTEAGSRGEYVEATWGAVRSLDAEVFQVTLPSTNRNIGQSTITKGGGGSSTALNGLGPVVNALKETDIVIDLTIEGLIHVPQRQEILNAGARILSILETPDVIERMLPREELRYRVERSADILKKTKQMHVTSKAGTDFRVDMTGARVNMQYGYTDQPGRWDNFPGGFVAAYPANDEGVEGVLVLDRGDYIFPFKKYIESPVILNFRKGYIEKVEGNNHDAWLLRNYLEECNDPKGYGVSHVGWGLDETAHWDAMLLYNREALGQDMRAYYGNFMFSNGPNPVVGRSTSCHCDIPMRNCSIYTDSTPVIIDGNIVDEGIKCKPALQQK